MLETLEDRKTKLISYLETVDVNETWRQRLMDEKKLGITTQVYLFYPELFWNIFSDGHDSEAGEEELSKLCIAGYLYFGSILLQDKLLDTRVVSGYESVLQISWMQEECLRILSTIFPPDAPFWNLWVERRNEYFSSVGLQTQETPLTLSEYEHLADGKSAFGKVAIDCCYSLFKTKRNQAYHHRLVQSHAYFSMGVQVLDDIEDMEEDFNTRQINLVLQWARSKAREKSIPDLNNIRDIKKFVYVSGVYGNLIDLACDYLQKALHEIKDIPKSEKWKACIQYKLRKALQRKQVFTIYTKELYAKMHYSTTPLCEHNLVTPAGCLEKAMKFVFDQQEADGQWTDMVTNAGFSNVWTTGFVLSNVSGSEAYPAEKNKAIAFLLENQIQHSLWGYSQRWNVADADSSTNVLMALYRNNVLDNRLIKQWIEKFKVEDGFTTYADEAILRQALPEFKNFDGWTRAHECVSALAFYFVSMLPGTCDEEYEQLKYILLGACDHDTLLEGYWWTSPLYASTYLVRGILAGEKTNTLSKTVTNVIDRMLKKRNDDGSFGTAFDRESAFYTALVLDMLCTTRNVYSAYKKDADELATWLMHNQLTDGSFYPSYILRVPAPDIREPSDIENWSTEAAMPVNVVKKDIMRLYTAAVVCSAMMKYNKCLT